MSMALMLVPIWPDPAFFMIEIVFNLAHAAKYSAFLYKLTFLYKILEKKELGTIYIGIGIFIEF